MAGAVATASVRKSQLVTTPTTGVYAVQLSPGVYLSQQPDGSYQTRTVIGVWEQGTLHENKWTVSDPSFPTGNYATLVDLDA